MDAAALVPLAVLPIHQHLGHWEPTGIARIEERRQTRHNAVLVLGEPTFCPRFGFIKASVYGIRCPFDVPDEAFMVAELNPGPLAGQSGVVKYRPEFDLVIG